MLQLPLKYYSSEESIIPLASTGRDSRASSGTVVVWERIALVMTQTWAAPALSETVYSGDEKEMIRSVEDKTRSVMC